MLHKNEKVMPSSKSAKNCCKHEGQKSHKSGKSTPFTISYGRALEYFVSRHVFCYCWWRIFIEIMLH